MDITTQPTTAFTTNPMSSDKAAISSDFETFIKMLTAQMENQDPLNPLDSQDFATQLATFSGVEQQVKTNDLLAALGTQATLSGLGDMATWVGMEARIAAPANFDGTPIEIIANPPAVADATSLIVTDATGVEVRRISIPVSDAPFFWDGLGQNGEPLPRGQYSFAIEAKSNGNVIDTHVPDVFAKVDEVRLMSGAAVVVLNGGAIHPAGSVSGLR